jgi:hypothetical protein
LTYSKARANAVGRRRWRGTCQCSIAVRVFTRFTAFAQLTRQCWIMHGIMMRVCNPQKRAHWIALEALKCQVVGRLRSCYGSLFGLVLYGRTAQRSVPISIDGIINWISSQIITVKKPASTFWNSVTSHGIGERCEHSSDLG